MPKQANLAQEEIFVGLFSGQPPNEIARPCAPPDEEAYQE